LDLFDEIIVHLELEKELGTRTVEIDRALLLPPKAAVAQGEVKAEGTDRGSRRSVGVTDVEHANGIGAMVASAERRHPLEEPRGEAMVASAERRHPLEEPRGETMVASAERRHPLEEMRDYAFLTAGELSAEGEALLAKMIQAMGCPAEKVMRLKTAPFAGGAKIAVVMGSEALRAFAPGTRAGLGAWTTIGKTPAVVTYSPDRLLRFFANDPAKLREGKQAVWKALQEAMKRVGN